MLLTTLINAKKIIETKGWCQERATDEIDRVCASQAILQAVQTPILMGRLHPNVLCAHWTLERLAGKSVPEYNDSHTEAEVLTLFDQAIAAELEKIPVAEREQARELILA